MTLRTRLTLLYAVPFLASGVVLVTIPLLQNSSTAPVGSGRPPEGTVDGPVLDRMVAAALIGLAAMVVVSVVAGWLVAGRFLRPLWTITATARDISASNLHRRLGLGRSRRADEFTLLAATLDDLFARLEAVFESQRRFVANAAHELRTPLTAERTLLQVALADPDPTVESLRVACTEVLTLGRAQERLIDALLTLATSERGLEHREPVDLAAIAGEVAEPRARTSLAPATVWGDARLVEILVTNLVDKRGAVQRPRRHRRGDHLHGGPAGAAHRLQHRAGGAARRGGAAVRTVPAPGAGARGRRRAGPRRRRARAGLAIVRAVAAAHGGTVTADPNPDGGLTVDVRLPVPPG